MGYFNSAADLIGNTPLVFLKNLCDSEGLCASVFAKLEAFNPAGSAKDRVAKKMIEDAEKAGLIKEGATIIEPTSGNTGIGLCAVCVPKGYRVIIVMPETMSIERQKLMTAYGAELVLTEGSLGMSGSIKKAEELKNEIEGAFIPSQFSNPSNAAAHFDTTGPEIYRDLDGKVDAFVAGVGTGGTITGVGKYLKSQNPEVKIYAVEPEDSAVLSGKGAGAHKLQGIGAGFIPEVLDTSVFDEVVTLDYERAKNAARLLAKKEGILAGISSGAALSCAIELARKEENRGKNIVAFLPDSGERYLSTDLFI